MGTVVAYLGGLITAWVAWGGVFLYFGIGTGILLLVSLPVIIAIYVLYRLIKGIK